MTRSELAICRNTFATYGSESGGAGLARVVKAMGSSNVTTVGNVTAASDVTGRELLAMSLQLAVSRQQAMPRQY